MYFYDYSYIQNFYNFNQYVCNLNAVALFVKIKGNKNVFLTDIRKANKKYKGVDLSYAEVFSNSN